MFDAEGYLTHLGRADNTMNAGGYRVSPVELEAALAMRPGLAEIGVAERRVAPDVSAIAAYVVRSPGCALTEAEVWPHAACKQVNFLPVPPRSANGKLPRRQLG